MNLNLFLEEVKKLEINLTKKQLQQLEKYYHLLIEYNKKVNLTRIIEKNDVYLKHFYDSMTISKIINLNKFNSLCDLGSGAGFPGIVLKIVYPHLNITLIDSSNKRITFLNYIIKELELLEINAIHTRIEDYAKITREAYDIVTARAVASLDILVELGISLVKTNKYFIAMKGNLKDEINLTKKLEKNLKIKIDSILEFLLPIEKSHRTLIKIKKNNITPLNYPRKIKKIEKNRN